MNNATPGVWTNEQMLRLINSAKERLRAEAEEMAHADCYQQRCFGLGRYNSPAQNDAMFRSALGEAALRIFRRETEPFLSAIARAQLESRPQYRVSMHTHTGAVEVVDEGLPADARAFVEHMHACIRAYADMLTPSR